MSTWSANGTSSSRPDHRARRQAGGPGVTSPLEGFHRQTGDGPLVAVPAFGLEVRICLPPEASGGTCSAIETLYAPGSGPPLHRHPEGEFFKVIEGAFRYRVGDRDFTATAGDIAFAPGGVPHAFVNLSDRPARQLTLAVPALDFERFFRELAALTAHGPPAPADLARFGAAWKVDFLGPPLVAHP
jgi:quercetin dioxygenase-like cupin family protein